MTTLAKTALPLEVETASTDVRPGLFGFRGAGPREQSGNALLTALLVLYPALATAGVVVAALVFGGAALV